MKTLLAQLHERVMFIHVHRPSGWEFYINRKFAEGVARWPEPQLIGRRWLISDGAYLSYDGSKAYANAIKEKP